ncbi:MAG: DNA-binding protein [Desulfuromonadaceae bacterium]|nr:DNA-binding protein [Desulfuromonadaceae bacterium]MDD2855678.1 DNA-binding protein [Desulfuromonadaceae bacterium]
MKKNLIVSLSCLIAFSSATAALSTPDKGTAKAKQNHSEPAADQLSGKILQTMDSGGYTYVYIQKNGGEKVWVAAPVTAVTVGSKVSFNGGMEMVNFESKSLKRKFDRILFADAIISDTPKKGAATDISKNTSGGSKAAASSKDTKISVSKATGENAYTVQEIYAKSSKLDKKKVVIKGKVVKVSSGIMGKNWIHIQDGTGNQSKNNHNLVCTSLDMANVDDIVTVSGTLAKDRDFGGGYKYSAIVEDAKIRK